MAQPRKKTAPPATAPATAPVEARVLARAAHSGDPAVHQLMAGLQTARLNDDTERVSVLVGQLAELGYE